MIHKSEVYQENLKQLKSSKQIELEATVQFNP